MPERKHNRHPGSTLIPDDEIVDEVAIELFLKGARRVRLTREERIQAVLRVWRDEGITEPGLIRGRLGLSAGCIDSLMAEVRERVGADVEAA